METLVLGVSKVNLRLLWLIASESGDRNKMSFIGKVSKISSTCVDIPNFVGVYEYMCGYSELCGSIRVYVPTPPPLLFWRGG